MGAISITHILLVAVIVLVIFGPKRLPDLGKALGEGIRDFKKGLTEPTKDYKDLNQQAKINDKDPSES